MVLDGSVAHDAVLIALAAAGLSVRPGDDQADLVVDVGGVQLDVDIKVASTVTPGSLPRAVTRPASGSRARLLVADRIVAAARDILKQNGWGWLDLRGHLHLSGPGVLVDTAVPSWEQPREAANDPFVGKVALEVACELLMNPNEVPAVRELARRLGHSPSSISTSLRALRDAALVISDGTPVVPELFWELASAWRPEAVDVARVDIIDDPTIASALRTGISPLSDTGWALTDTRAAAAYGAPVALTSDYPPDFYVPDRVAAHRAQTMLGVPSVRSTRAATIRIAPVPQACDHRVSVPSSSRWPLTHPLFVALDLAKDPGRGREVLDGWTPPEGTVRVW
jgi:DNA-binding transcriptional ArsR family regulator